MARRLREAGRRGRTVTLKLTYADFSRVTRRTTLESPTDDAAQLYRTIRADLARADVARAVRHCLRELPRGHDAGGAGARECH